ncbi:MAG: tetratricopeptide repeat protein [Deltaproteobacteria bacterium]|nr:tetratricopeptide repeat protein [Deltaproteobacteria bacterium]
MKKHTTLLVLVLAFAAGGCKHVSPEDAKRAQDSTAIAVEHMNGGRYREALAELLKAEQLNPEDPEIQYALGLTYLYGFKRYQDSRQHLERALEMRPEFSEAENVYGVTLLEEGRYQEAIPHFERAMSNLLYVTPQYAEQNLGWALHKIGRSEEGFAHLQHAVQEAPELCGAYYQLGFGYGELDRLDQSIKWFEAFRQKCDDTALSRFVPRAQLAEVQYRLGMAYLKVGDSERARGSLQDCVTRFGSLPIAQECQKSLAVVP